MKKRRRVSVRYRENCGGVLRDLTSGFCKTVNSIADIDLYEDLRERLFKKEESIQSEQKLKMSA